MMNATVERIMNDQEVTTLEALELVNVYELSRLSVDRAGGAVIMNVNSFEVYGSTYEFGQVCSEQRYTFNKEEIESIETKYSGELDHIFVTCYMKDGSKLTVIIYGVSTNHKTAYSKDVHEVSLEELNDALQMEGNWMGTVRLETMSGIMMKMCPTMVYVSGVDDKVDEPSLYICGGETSIDIPVYDDSCNEFYVSKTDARVEVYIKPYEQAFTEISMVFVKIEEQSEPEIERESEMPEKTVAETVAENMDVPRRKKSRKIVNFRRW